MLRRNQSRVPGRFSGLLLLLLLGLVGTVGCGSPTGTLNIRAIYTDLDGTVLLAKDHLPNPATVEALRAFQRAGGKVGIATGRTLEQIAGVVTEGAPGSPHPTEERRLRPDLPLVLFNGAVVLSPDRKTLLSAQALDVAVVQKVDAVLAQEPAVRGVVSHFLRRTLVSSDRSLGPYLQRLHIEHPIVEPNLVQATHATAADDPLIKLVVVVDPAKAPALESALAAALGGAARAVLTNPSVGCVEVLAPQTHKAIGIRKALTGTGIAPDELLVFGDAPNDTEMLREFRHSVAVGNCSGSACEAAAARLCHACTADTDGLARVIGRYVLGGDTRADPFALAPCDCREQLPK